MPLKLLKVVVQAHFVVLDAGGDVESEVVAEPMVVWPKDWPTFPQTEFQEAYEALARSVDSDHQDDGVDPPEHGQISGA